MLVPRHSEFAPGHSLLSYNSQIPEPMPNNVSFTQNGFIQSQLTSSPHSHLSGSSSSTMTALAQSPSSPSGNVASPSSVSPHSPYGSIPGQLKLFLFYSYIENNLKYHYIYI